MKRIELTPEQYRTLLLKRQQVLSNDAVAAVLEQLLQRQAEANLELMDEAARIAGFPDYIAAVYTDWEIVVDFSARCIRVEPRADDEEEET